MFAARQPHHKTAADTNVAAMPMGGTRTRYWLSGSEEIANLDANRNVIRRFIPGAAIDERVAQIDANGAVTFIHNDKQNSVIAISDAVGNPVQRRGYGTYGETDPAQMVGTTSAGTTPHPFGYTGRRWDPDLGLYYYRARWYDPQLGTFLETDPIGELDYVNLYSYVGLEPGNGTDPTGMCIEDLCVGEAIAISGFCARTPACVRAVIATVAAAGYYSREASKSLLGPNYIETPPLFSIGPRPLEARRGNDRPTSTGTSQSRASAAPAGPPNDPNDDYNGTYKTRIPGQSGKEAASNAPSWARGNVPRTGESGNSFARRLMDQEYGAGNWRGTGPGSEFNKIKKFGDRGFR
jgi:RHS repeat-associated protein